MGSNEAVGPGSLKSTIQQQIRANAVALISLVMAIVALSYSGWRVMLL